MRQVFIADLVAKQVTDVLGHLIYVVRDGEIVFYVGQSRRDVITRFAEHMQAPSRLGRLIAANAPQSDNWTVDFYTLADCRPFVSQKSLFAMQEWQQFDMDMAEKALIRQMRPVLNRDFNPKPLPLPSHYHGHDIAAEREPPSLNTQFLSGSQRIWHNRLQIEGWVFVRQEHGRSYWQHRLGQKLSAEEMEALRLAGKFPPRK